MAFSPPVVGCLVKKGLQKGGQGHPGPSLATPLLWHASISTGLGRPQFQLNL